MTTFPDLVDLYPDVAAIGSLAAALQDAAARQGLSLGEVATEEKQPLIHASVASMTPLRGRLGVNAGHFERCWLISGWGQGIALVQGVAHDLGEVAVAADAWRHGVPVRDIQRSAPFVELTPLAEAAERGPEHVVAAAWQMLRRHAEEAGWAEYRDLIEAAYAEPKLRQLYPYTSHWSLRFSTTTGFPFSPDAVCLDAFYGSAEYVVKASWNGVILGETDTAADAVALAVEHLPEDIGQAIAGPYCE